MADSSNGNLACVTGASGFIGTHMVRELISRGYTVRATVRDAKNTKRTAHIVEQAAAAPERLTLHSADLMNPGAFDDIIAGCDTVFHVASAVYLTAKNPQKEIVDPAVQGTQNVFSAIAKAGTVTKVGLTSSIAAVLDVAPRPGHTYTEADWVRDATVDKSPYPLSKRLAEEAAWAAHKAMPEDQRYELVVVNPVLVTGPIYAKVHVRSSPGVLKSLMTGAFKGCPNLGFGLVDVRDVCQAMIGGLEAGGKTGRYLLHAESLWMRQIAGIIAELYPDRDVPLRTIPNPLMYVAALFDKRLTWDFLRRNLGNLSAIDHSKVRTELGVELRDMRTSIKDTCDSFVELGLA